MISKGKSLDPGQESASGISTLVGKWVRPEVRDLAAYHVASADGKVKLDAMENPYSWPVPKTTGQGVLSDDQMHPDFLQSAAINRYPDASSADLKQAIIKAFNIPDRYDLLLGNGSDELIQIIAMAVSGQDRVIMAPEPSFVMYRIIALMCRMQFVGVPLTSNFEIDADAMLEAVNRHNPAVIFLAYPNNPTGNLFSADAMEAITRQSDGLVVVDEAYFAFAGESFIDRLEEFDNLLIMRTVSKMGLAGLRLGYLIGQKPWIAEFDKMRLPYNINVLTQQVAQTALANIDRFNEQTERICRERQRLTTSLGTLKNVEVYPSRANFILFRVGGYSSTEIFEKLLERNVLIKNLGAQQGLLEGCLRVTVGTPEENGLFLDSLISIISS